MKISIYFYLLILSTSLLRGQSQNFEKVLDDDNSKYTNVGNLRVTITNFGTYGHGFSKWPVQPSCEYPSGSGIEHIFDGGLWVGAYKSNDSLGSGKTGPFVTTGAVDAVSVAARGGGFEWTNARGSLMLERSSLLSSRYYSPSAVSHQDFVAEYTDTNLVFLNGEPIVDHSPLGLVVRQESYTWNFPFADDFVIMNYWIKNTSGKYLTEVCIGLWTDAVVRNTKVTTPSGSSFYNKGGNGYKDSLRIAYEFDSNGDIGQTDSYLGVQFLGADKKYDSVNFVSWQFRNTSDPNFFAPQNDFDRYNKLLGYFGQGGVNRYNSGINPSSLKSPSNRSIMISAGPIKYLAPGDSVNIIFAILCAKKYGSDPASLDTEEQKKNLYSGADWALRAYYGEDKNRNDILDAGEDIDGVQKITRYILPTPPNVPKVKVVPQSNRALLYWDNSSEFSVDPISGEIDFEGYRIYRSDAGKDLEQGTNYLNIL